MPSERQLLHNLFCSIISSKRERTDYTMELDSNNHSVLLLYYHLVLVVKYRRKVFSDPMSQYAKDIFVRIGSSYNITLEEWNHDQDHVHIMFRAHPNTEISKFVNAYKSASSRLIKNAAKCSAPVINIAPKVEISINRYSSSLLSLSVSK